MIRRLDGALRALGGRAVLGFALVWVGAGATACGPCWPDAPAAALTPGDDWTTDFADGDGIVMVHGPQGGWHVEFGVRVVDPDPDVVIDVTVHAMDGRIVSNHYELNLDDHDGCTGGRTALFGFINIREIRENTGQTPPQLLSGEELHLQLDVIASEGRASDEVWLIAEPDPKDVEE